MLALALRILALVGLAGAFWIAAVNHGKSVCQRKWEAAQAAIQARHADAVAQAAANATAKALEDARKESKNDKQIDDIVREAADDPADLCISPGVLERLRQLQ